MSITLLHSKMPRLCLNARRKVIVLHSTGSPVAAIKTRLNEENIFVTRRSLDRLIKKFRETKEVHRFASKKAREEDYTRNG